MYSVSRALFFKEFNKESSNKDWNFLRNFKKAYIQQIPFSNTQQL